MLAIRSMALERSNNRTPLAFWLLGAALVLYVALCTGQRENIILSDSWEHHRALVALTRHLWRPGNPTYASDLPSVRYSPYFVFWAVVCRTIHIDPYLALSIAAVVNTALLVIGVWMLLRSFGEAASAAAVLFVMIALYGSAPGWANSYALSDLSWQEVNPSAFSFALVLISWSIFRRIGDGRARWGRMIIVISLMTVAMLDHGMTAALGIIALFLLAALMKGQRLKMLVAVAAIAVCVAAICSLWPWYSFWSTVRWQGDPDYWFDRYFLHQELTCWIVPAIVCATLALPLIDRPLIRFSIAGGLLSVGGGLVSLVNHSPTLARFPLPGLVFFHIMVGLFAHEVGLFSPSTWPARLRSIFSPLPQGAFSVVQFLLAIVLLGCLVPQLRDIAKQPYLARPYLVKIFHGKDRQLYLRENLIKLLSPVGEDDVVLSDLQTSWLVPGINGKIVAALHYELFVPQQRQRQRDLETFFATDSEAERRKILQRYNVRWIILNHQILDERTYVALLRPAARVAQVDDLVLMDARKWVRQVVE